MELDFSSKDKEQVFKYISHLTRDVLIALAFRNCFVLKIHRNKIILSFFLQNCWINHSAHFHKYYKEFFANGMTHFKWIYNQNKIVQSMFDSAQMQTCTKTSIQKKICFLSRFCTKITNVLEMLNYIFVWCRTMLFRFDKFKPEQILN